MPETLDFPAFAARYCERQEQTPEGLFAVLSAQRERYQPEGWMLLECQAFDSSRHGSLTILPYGPNNTFRQPPDQPISPRGLASDMSVVVAILPAGNLTRRGGSIPARR